MSSTIAMDRAGRLVIPKELRTTLHLEQSASFRAEVVGGRLELTPIVAEPELTVIQKHGLPVIAKTGERFSAAEAIRQTRGEREKTMLQRVRSPRR